MFEVFTNPDKTRKASEEEPDEGPFVENKNNDMNETPAI